MAHIGNKSLQPERSENLIWYGPYSGSLDGLNVTKPVPELPNLYNLAFAGSVYACTVGVFDDAIIVTDAAPHQSKLVIQWIEQTFHRKPTHLLVSLGLRHALRTFC